MIGKREQQRKIIEFSKLILLFETIYFGTQSQKVQDAIEGGKAE